MAQETVTTALIVIGDEILSGRTKDRNIGYIAAYLTAIGIRLSEVRVVADDEDRIVEAVNELRARATYVFTTGGIGPTHDDITADSIAKAFGVGIDVDERALAIMRSALRRGSADAGTPAHGAHSRRRRARRELGFDDAGLHARKRHRAGRRALDHAGECLMRWRPN